MGLEIRMSGAKKMRPMTVAVMVRPVRKRRMPPETMRVKNPMSWVELGAWSWSLRRNDEAGVGRDGRCAWPEPEWRSAIVEGRREIRLKTETTRDGL